jgi:hypothetical protein
MNMGLDQYLNRMPRYRGATAQDVSAVESYLGWKRAKESGSQYAQGSFKNWCGLDRAPKKEYRDFYSKFYTPKYSYWDTEKQHPWCRVMEHVGYWRKANHIHAWFVENIQNGEDDCGYHREVTKEDLIALRDVCYEVLFKPDRAEDLLPTRCGFFFGGTDYDEYYISDIKDTIEIIDKVLDTTDFDKEMIYYVSSW